MEELLSEHNIDKNICENILKLHRSILKDVISSISNDKQKSCQRCGSLKIAFKSNCSNYTCVETFFCYDCKSCYCDSDWR